MLKFGKVQTKIRVLISNLQAVAAAALTAAVLAVAPAAQAAQEAMMLAEVKRIT